MSHSYLLNAPVLSFLPNNLDSLVVLDVGCGFGDWGFMLMTRKGGSPYLVGGDVWSPHLERIHPLKVYDDLIRIEAPYLPVRSKSVDIVLACEILEHMPKDLGVIFLEDLQRVARKMIIVSTPLNYGQDEIYGNPYERHVSDWSRSELESCGFEKDYIYAA